MRIASQVAHAGRDDAMTPPLVGKMASEIAKAMTAMHAYGDAQVRQELARQRRGVRALMDYAWEGATDAQLDRAYALQAPTTPRQQALHLVASAKLSAQSAADKLLATARAEALRLRRAGWEPDEIEDALKIHMRELSDADVARLANQEVNEAFSMGRVAAAAALKDEIESATYSAILDERCCRPCEANDGTEVRVDSAEYEELMPPYTGCEGDDQCRCLWIYNLAQPDEQPDETEDAA